MNARVTEAMMAFARRVYSAGFHVRENPFPDPPSATVFDFLQISCSDPSIYSSPELDELCAAIAEDPAFEPFSESAQSIGPGPFARHPSGGFALQTESACVGMLEAVATEAQLRGVRLDEDAFVREALENLAQLESLSAGGSVLAVEVTHLFGISLPRDLHVETPWGRIQPSPDGRDALLVHRGEVPIKLYASSQDAESNEDAWAAQRAPSRAALLLPLAFVLATRELDIPFTPTFGFSIRLWPFRTSGGGGPLLHETRAAQPLDSDLGKALTECAELVDRAHHSAMDLAAGRLVRGVQERYDPSDTLIDAVMAWESLMGAQTEVTFRVTAALALLLEPNPDKRGEFRKGLAKIYGVRSKIVHGSALRDSSDLLSKSRAAVRVGALAMLELYRRGPEWTSLASQDRSERLILHG